MAGNLLIAQSGGPTAVINATLSGILEEGLLSGEIDRIYGSRYGIQGLLEEKLLELSQRIPELLQRDFPGRSREDALSCFLQRLSKTPAAALGSCRYKLEDPSEFERILELFRKYGISYFIYIGGNDSMDTAWKLSRFFRERGEEGITVVGAPKTIDNDLFGIDHCPGFGSAAKYIATSLSELSRELFVYEQSYVIIVEMMGRNAGWLTAAAALSERMEGSVPMLIYLEEHSFSVERFLSDLRRALSERGRLIVAVSEGIKDEEGMLISDYDADAGAGESGEEKGRQPSGKAERGRGDADAFGHRMHSGAGRVLEEIVRERIGCKVRSIELNLLQRCAGHLLSKTDVTESRELGRRAVRLALSGRNGEMSSLRRSSAEGGEYRAEYFGAPLSEIANREKKVPSEWITEDGCHLTEDCIRYLLPLIQGEESCDFEDGLPKYVEF